MNRFKNSPFWVFALGVHLISNATPLPWAQSPSTGDAEASQTHSASVRHHGWLPYFGPMEAGLKLPLSNQGSPPNVAVSLDAICRGPLVLDEEPVRVDVAPALVAYVRSEVVEWYVETDSGLEHCMLLQSRPLVAGMRDDAPLRLRLRTNENSCPSVLPGGRSALLSSADRRATFYYAGLHVWDADGDNLPAFLQVEGEGLSIVVDDSQAQYPITVDPVLGCLQAYLAPLDLAPWSQFGYAVAIDGDRIAVTTNALGGPRGKVDTYRKTGNQWLREARLAGEPVQLDGFGSSVALRGNLLAVGAPYAGVYISDPDPGAAFVFAWNGQQWVQSARVLPNDGGSYDCFGLSVALAPGFLIVGAPFDDDLGKDSGSVYVFRQSGTSWVQSAKLTASNGRADDYFGGSVDAADGVIVVGADGHDIVPYDNLGGAYVFRKVGALWVEEAFLPAPGIPYYSGHFGYPVSVSGERIAIGEPGQPNSIYAFAHVYRYSANNWNHEAVLQPQDPSPGNAFGMAVDIDGDRAFVGSPGTPGGGAAYVFDRVGSAWNQTTKVQSIGPNPGAFGNSVAGNQQDLVVGEPLATSSVGYEGAASVFVLEAQSVYCTAKTNSLNCVPAISGVGNGSATQSSGMVVSCANVLNNVAGLLFYSTTGRSAVPFQGGYLCVNGPVRRTPGLSSGGSPPPTNDCSGILSIDMNAFARGQLGGSPDPELGVMGALVDCQWWARDPGFLPPYNTLLSDAFEYTVCL